MRYKPLLIACVVLTLFASCIYADPNGASISEGTGDNSEPTVAATSTTADGGYYTELNATQDSQTDNWQIYYGTVKASFTLQDGAGATAYNWTTIENATSGNIYFANATTIDWASVSGGTSMPERTEQEDTALSLSGSDNVTSTFVTGTHPAINSDVFSVTADNTFTAVTKQSDETDAWNSMLLWDNNDNKIYAGIIGQGTDAFNGAAANYQVMVPTSDAGTRDYYVFVEI
ncbi:MAG: hypothetical protein R6V53_02040 [Candidatus Woesearchaeota archaeon]